MVSGVELLSAMMLLLKLNSTEEVASRINSTKMTNIERAFMHDEIEKNQSMAAFLRTKCRSLWQEARQFFSFFDLVRFCRYLSVIDEQRQPVNQKKNSNKLYVFFFNIVLATRQVSSRTTS